MAPKVEQNILKWFPVTSSFITLIFTAGIAIGGYQTFARAAEAIPQIQTDVAIIKVQMLDFKEWKKDVDHKLENVK